MVLLGLCGDDVQVHPYNQIQTRLTYNCAHLRSTKECLTLEYLEKENKSIAEKEEGGKYLEGNYILVPVRIEALLVDT